MKLPSRRAWLGGSAGLAGLVALARWDALRGLLPPDAVGPYALGNSLSYAAYRLLARHGNAREFPRRQISPQPFANPAGQLPADFQASVSNWRLMVDGLVKRPLSLSLADLRAMPASSQITALQCEEGWSYIAEWTGVPLARVLEAAGAQPQARYVVYRSLQPDWWDSLDIDEARHGQTLLAYGMNQGDLPVPFGGPLRMRVPRQLGYKSVKYLVGLTVTDNLQRFGRGLGGSSPEYGYSWYAGI